MVSAGRELPQPLEPSQRVHNRQVLAQALASCVQPVSAALSATDPYADRFLDRFTAALGESLAEHWPTIRSRLAGLSDESVLRHAWAVCRSGLEFAALYRSALVAGGKAVGQLARSLLAQAPPVDPLDDLARAVAFGAESPPDFSLDDRIKPGLRARYALAVHLLNGSSSQALIEVAQQIVDASPYVRRRELLRLLASSHKPATFFRLDPVAFAMLSRGAQDLLMTSDSLIEAFVPLSIGRGEDLQSWIRATRVKRARLERKAQSAVRALDTRDFTRLNRSLSTLDVEPLARAVCSGVELIAQTAPTADQSGDDQHGEGSVSGADELGPSKWAPMSEGSRNKLRVLFPQIAVRSHWSLTAPSVAAALCEGTLSIKALKRRELDRLRATWSGSAQARLLSAGLHTALDSSAAVWPKLSLRRVVAIAGKRRDFVAILARTLSAQTDAAELLAVLRAHRGDDLRRQVEAAIRENTPSRDLDEIALPWIGTDRWSRAGGWKLHDGEIEYALERIAERQVVMVDHEGFSKVAARALVRLPDVVSRHHRRNAPADPSPYELGVRLALRYRSVQQELLRVAPRKWLHQYVQAATGRKALLAALARTGPNDLHAIVYEARLESAKSPSELLTLLAEGARMGSSPAWSPRWSALAGSGVLQSVDGLTCLVLSLRNDLKRLRRMTAAVPDDDMRAALGQAACILLKSTGRPQPLLELGSLLGISTTPTLAALMGRMRPQDPPGHRLNGAYLKWTLPKKSGGTRPISAPDRQLMLVQRAILSRMLTPLGAHPAACGFVKGRSIKDNALPHVGSEIVANADVENCFPSVKWPLVLAALRRDVGAQLSAPALQLLVDLCTSEGALPIGAPTSPALLNRVLLRTDEILADAAARKGCVYTRYADDLSFSGGHGAVEMLGVAKSALLRIGLQLDPRKTNIFRRGRRQVCTGLVVNEQVSVPRRVRRRLRAAVHAVEQGRATTWHGLPQSDASLRGRIAFVRMIHPDEGKALTGRLQTVSDKKALESEAEEHD